ncbi:hypothetical protein EDD21DRAFT_435381 [Dissophora ornata]|nr:hypothetical protein EDD21DRAFT_435381 [Dissophora ornata]
MACVVHTHLGGTLAPANIVVMGNISHSNPCVNIITRVKGIDKHVGICAKRIVMAQGRLTGVLLLPIVEQAAAHTNLPITHPSAATIINSDDENVMQNMSIPRLGGAFSTKMYQRRLQRAKQQRQFAMTLPPNQGGPSRWNVLQIKQLIQPIQCVQAPVDQAQTWAPLSASVRTYVVSAVRIQQALRAFYSSGLFKVKAIHPKQAKTATLDKRH